MLPRDPSDEAGAALRESIREEAIAWAAPPRKPAGPDVAAAPPAPSPAATTE